MDTRCLQYLELFKCNCHKITRVFHSYPSTPPDSRPFTMNFDSYASNSSGSLSMSFHDSIEQSQFRIDSPSIATHRANVTRENPVPVTYTPASPAIARPTYNLRLSPWENRACIDMPSFSSGLALRDDYLTVQIAIAKNA